MSSVKDAALALVEKYGWHIFRVRVTHNEAACGGTASCKHTQPLEREWQRRSSNDLAVIEAWDWSRANAYGIHCGASGIIGVDVDPGDEWDLDSDTVFSTGRGTHYIYEDLIGVATNRAGLDPWGVDIRSGDGFLIGPGSYHPHGKYEIIKDGFPPPAPGELYDALDRPAAKVAAIEERLDKLDAMDRLEGVYRRVEEAKHGERNNTLNIMAGAAAGLWVRLDPEDQVGVLSEDAIKQRLFEAVPDLDDEDEARKTIESGWAYGLANPLGDAEPVDVQGLFDLTPELRHIRQLAYARMSSPHTLLAATLARVLAEVPPTTVLPPVVGTRASLNLGVALVGPSGSGKSTAIRLSSEALGLVGAEQTATIDRVPGSGEGLAATFLEDEKEVDDNGRLVKTGRKVVIDDPRRVMIAEEIASLHAGSKRQGATIMPELRKALRGEMLGQENASSETRRRVPADSYRLVAMVGVQPEHSHALLNADEVAGGTPQRFLWASAIDPLVPDDPVDDPGPLNWELPRLPREIDYPERIKKALRENHLRGVRGERANERGHITLTALKVAAALALLHGETEITEQWWDIASALTDRSMEVQRECYAALAEAAARENESRGRAQAQIEAARDAHTSDLIYERIKRHVLKTVTDEGVGRAVVRRGLKRSDKDYLDDVLEQMQDDGLIRMEEVDRYGQKGIKIWTA